MPDRKDFPPDQEHLNPNFWDGHGFGVECCVGEQSDLEVYKKAIAFSRRRSLKEYWASRTLKPFAGQAVPDTTLLSPGQRFVLAAYPKGTIFRLRADTINTARGFNSATYLGLLDQIPKGDGTFADTLLQFNEKRLQESTNFF